MGQINEKDQSHAKFLVKIMNTLMENSDFTGLDIESLQNTVVANSKNAGKEFRRFLENGARVNVITGDVIDCDADPFVPDGWSVESHKKHGMMVWNSNAIMLHLEKEQNTSSLNGNKLRKRIEKLPALNANVLDYLLKHPDLIPESWKGKYVFFWGTIYRNSGGLLCVRCLRWNGGKWRWRFYWLVFDWRSGHPAALASA